MFWAGTSLTKDRTRLPSTAGNPRKSALTIATRVPSCSRTKARTVKCPSLWVTGCDGPTPPLTGNNGSGVTIRTLMPARKSAAEAAWIRKRNSVSHFEFIMSKWLVLGEVMHGTELKARVNQDTVYGIRRLDLKTSWT